MNEGAARLRALVQGGGFFAAPGAMEPFTARIIESLGFRAVYLGGNAIGLHLVAGQPMVTVTETVACARAVLAAIDLPLIVDAGAGFGEAAHAHRAVRELERAGIAAIHIDDQPYPKRAQYHIGEGGLAPVETVAQKLAVAAAARRDENFQIFARTDALRVTGSLEQTAERCRAYVEAGVDGLAVLDLTPEQLPALRDQIGSLPLAWLVSPSMPMPSLAELEEAGFQLALYPFNTVAAIAEAVTALWTDLRDGGRINQSEQMRANWRHAVQHLIGMDTYWDIEKWTGSGSNDGGER